jgi:tRNA A-37 threonylcarbamoyl transferase component Bud32
MVEDEQELTGGNASQSVVRIGHTVRKPWLENSPAVQSYLRVLRSSGVDVPQPLGRDDDGRHVVEYVEGVLALDQLPLGRDELLRVGRMIRQIHDASEKVVIPNPDGWKMLLAAENPNLMCHNDLAPWNLVMGDRWAFIDWDGAGPSTRLWDLAYAAQSFGVLFDGQPVEEAALRLRAVVDGYEADGARPTESSDLGTNARAVTTKPQHVRRSGPSPAGYANKPRTVGRLLVSRQHHRVQPVVRRSIETARPAVVLNQPTCTQGRFVTSGSASRRISRVTGAISPSPRTRKRKRFLTGFPSVQRK